MYESHQYFMLGKGLLRMKIGGEVTETESQQTTRGDHGMIVTMVKISRVSQTPSTSIFYLSSAMSLYTDSGPLAFPQVPHKKPKNSTQLYLPASVLMAIQQKSYPSQCNRLSPLLPLLQFRSPFLHPPLPGQMWLTISNLHNNLQLSINICQIYLLFQPLYFLTCLISDILSAALDPSVAIGTIIIYFVNNTS